MAQEEDCQQQQQIVLANDNAVVPRQSTRATRPPDRFAYAVEYLQLT